MTVQNEVAWIIDIIKSNYPATWPADLVRRNRDDAVTLDKPDSPVKEKAVSVDRYNVIGVSTGSKNRSLYGTTPQYDVETTVDVRIEGKYVDDWGEVADIDEWKTLVAYVQNAINQELTYPAVDTGNEDIGRVQYQDLGIIDETDQSVQHKDYYLTTFTVRLRGKQDTP